MDAHDEHLLVVGAVEDADAAALGQAPDVAPHEVVVEVLRRGLLEREHLAALRIHARHHVLDRAVLAGGVHRLEDEQQRPAVLGVEHLLLLREPLAAACRSSAASPLSIFRPRVSPGSMSFSRKRLPLVTRNGSMTFSMRSRISFRGMATSLERSLPERGSTQARRLRSCVDGAVQGTTARNRNAAKRRSCTAPCMMLVRPEPTPIVQPSALLADDLVVLGMGADPEPQQALGCFHRDCSVMQPDTRRPEPTDFPEVERRVSRIGLQKGEGLVGEPLNLGG